MFAWLYANVVSRVMAVDGTLERRRELLRSASGRVLELGAGNGLNLPHYPQSVTEVLASEPDPYMRKRLALAVGSAPRPARILPTPAESVPLEDSSVDTVVATLVLCSVRDLPGSLSEAHRVLRPGGRLLLYEHVRSRDDRVARWQDLVDRPWGYMAAGCHPNRDTEAATEAAGFRLEEVDRFDLPGPPWMRPHVLANAVRP